MKKKITATPVNRIAEPCACCADDKKRGRGARVDASDGWTFYYCDSCIGKLAEAKAHH